ncbi:MAG: hypothetical protein M1299_10025 [Firmicutes bacterium]|nr:hypothetical protein [Bacillota bacterium]MCL5040143.1 hypothetical protein [Bacillota bacterium]
MSEAELLLEIERLRRQLQEDSGPEYDSGRIQAVWTLSRQLDFLIVRALRLQSGR